LRSAQGPTKPPNQWVPGALTAGVKWRGHKADHLPPSAAEVKKAMPPLPNMSSLCGA